MGIIDAIIFCTQSPDYVMPSNSFLLQRDLGIQNNILAFDYNLACSGYLYGLLMASSFIHTGVAKNILLVTSDTYSKYLADDDRSTRMLFGDGASASWIGDPNLVEIDPLISKFDDFQFGSDGSGWNNFIIESGGSRNPPGASSDRARSGKIHMNGLQVLNLVNDRVVKQILQLLNKNKIGVNNIDQFFLHQASCLALKSICRRLNIRDDQAFSNIKFIGNTVSSSIPILIKDYFSERVLPRGSRVLLCGFGVGYSWGSLVATV